MTSKRSSVASESHPTADIANGERFIKQHGENVRYNTDWKTWLTWDGDRWIEHEKAVEALAKRTAVSIMDESKAKLSAGRPDQAKELAGWAIRSQSAAGVRGMLSMASSHEEVWVTTKDLDADPMALNTPFGTIDLRTGTLRNARREDLMTRLTRDGLDPQAQCPLWEKTLAEIFLHEADHTTDHDLIHYFQRWAGYCLTGLTTDHVLPILYGDGRNGKSLVAKTIHKLLGDYGRAMDAGMLLVHRSDPHPAWKADLLGRRLVVSAETGSGRKLDEALVKELTGGDMISTHRMHENWWEFEPSHKLLILTNHKPKIIGTDTAIWSRVHLIPFYAKFEGANRDPDREHKLVEERPGIMAWMVRGCLEWQRMGGLHPPAAVVAATQEYREESDSLRRFIAECCVCVPAAWVAVGELFDAYRVWGADEGCEVQEAALVGKALNKMGFTAETVYDPVSKKARRVRKGIGLVLQREL